MSFWTHINGTIQVCVPGRTQPEIQYILSSVLDHLPRVTGSEGDMCIHYFKKDGFSCCMSCDEYGMRTNNLIDRYGGKSRRGWLETQDTYVISVEGSLRDRFLNQTKSEFMKWLVRLAKRLWVEDVLVRISGYDKEGHRNCLLNMPDGMQEINEQASWYKDKYSPEEYWWGEHLMWRAAPNYDVPIEHVLKYTDNKEMEKEFIRRQKWEDDMENES